MNVRPSRWVDRYPLLSCYLATLGISWLGWIPVAASRAGLLRVDLPDEVELIAHYGPLLAAIILTWRRDGSTEVWRLLSALGRWKAGIGWYAVALLTTPAIAVLIVIVQAWLGWGVPEPRDFIPIPWPDQFSSYLRSHGPSPGLWGRVTAWDPVAALWLLSAFALTHAGVSEEVGSRGYALRSLMRRWSAVGASALLAVFWTVSHTDEWFWRLLFFDGPLAFAWLAIALLAAVPRSLLLTWIVLNARGSLLLPVLFHVSYDLTLEHLWLAWRHAELTNPSVSGPPPIAEMIPGLWVVAGVVRARFGPQLVRPATTSSSQDG